MTAVIVFSKDRAMQLDALLSSLRVNLGADVTPTVLWTASTPEYEQGYRLLFDRFATSTHFVRETNFRRDYEEALPASGYVMHLVDDDVIWGRANLGHAVYELDRDDELAAFSFRLGANCTQCYPLDADQALPRSIHAQPQPTLTWRYVGAEHDFGYPFSLDAHVLRVDDVRAMLTASAYSNPNQLEQTLASRAWMRSSMRPKMASYARSVVTGVPANRVNATHPNRCGTEWSATELNEAFLAGIRIAWRDMDWAAVDAAHAEIPYRFTAPIAKAA